jgi:hypothetical protein
MTNGHGPWIIEWDQSFNQWDNGVHDRSTIKVLKRNGSNKLTIFEKIVVPTYLQCLQVVLTLQYLNDCLTKRK